MSKAKKSLLEEGTVRQFMKLANIQPLASNFINETYGGMEEDEEESDEMIPPEMDPPTDVDAEIEMEPEAPVDGTSQSDMAAAIESALETFLQAGAEKVAAEFEGVEVAVEASPSSDAELEEPADMDVDGMDVDGMEPAGEESSFAPAVGEEGEEEEEGEVALENIDLVDEDAIMRETLRRVTKRLGAMNREHKLVESVTNKVFARLQKK